MKPEPTFKKLKRILSDLKDYNVSVDEHIKDQLKKHEQSKTTDTDQSTEGDSESTGDGDQPESTQEGDI